MPRASTLGGEFYRTVAWPTARRPLRLGPATIDKTLATARPPPPLGYARPKHYAWADLLQRTFAIDVLACPECGGRLRFLATIEDGAVIEKILV